MPTIAEPTEAKWRPFAEAPDVPEGWYLKSDAPDLADARGAVWVSRNAEGDLTAATGENGCGGYHLKYSGGGFMYGPIRIPTVSENEGWDQADDIVSFKEGWYAVAGESTEIVYVCKDESGAERFSSGPGTSIYGRHRASIGDNLIFGPIV